MNTWTVLACTALTLTACQGVKPEVRLADLAVTEVRLPASIGSTERMTLELTLGSNCSELPPQAFKVEQRSVKAQLPCPPVYFYSKQTYTDPGTPPRTDPFEVFVNGQSYGSVK